MLTECDASGQIGHLPSLGVCVCVCVGVFDVYMCDTCAYVCLGGGMCVCVCVFGVRVLLCMSACAR